ncbi:MAG: hypothetical protein JXC32_19750 [Anaerolineae bacterium]|nr:hypothetical protein [Anaerolineae bacterium]
MTPRDRLLTTLKGGTADRVPLVLPGFEFAARAAINAHPDPRRRELAHRVFDEVAYRVQVPSFTNRYLMTPAQRIHAETVTLGNGFEEIRGTIDTPKGDLTFVTQLDPLSGTTWTLEYPVKTMADIERIASIPWEMPEGLAPPAADRPEDFASRGILETRISSPFVCVAGMMTYERFLELTVTVPQLIEDLTEICRQRTEAVLDVLFAEPGIEYVWIGGSEWVTPPMASPRTYDWLVQGQEASVIRHARERAAAVGQDLVVHVHCHGHVRHALQRTIERDADYTEPVEPPPDGDIPMADAKALAAGRITLGGNIECRLLCNGTPADIDAALDAAYAGGTYRFILRPTEGPSPMMTARETRNWERMVAGWEERRGQDA